MRYFPVSQDINADPEVWELTDKFGDRSLRVWLEILSIADRNSGYLPGPWINYPSILAGRCKSTTRHLREVCEWVTRWLAIDSQGVARVRNYSKYHKTRAENRPPPNLTKPNLTNKEDTLVDQPKKAEPKIDDPNAFTVQDLVDSWNEVLGKSLPKVVWPLSSSRHRKAAMRVKEHQLLEYWQKVFDNIQSSDFLTGKGNGAWRCTFDFLIANDTNGLKIWEGAYANKNQGQGNVRPFQQRRY